MTVETQPRARMVDASDLQYALVLGQGRSGTNFLLGLLNRSPRTHCRNEPDQLPDGALRRLAPFRFFVDDPDRLAALWDGAIVDGALRAGPRDQPVLHPKDWVYPGTRRPGFTYVYTRYKAMHRFVHRTKPMDGREVSYPFWMTSRRRLQSAFHVFKINAAVGIAGWALENRPDARALHIVRHPGGFAKSWYRRWVQGRTMQGKSDQSADFDDTARLVALAERDSAWAARIGDIEAMTPVERELWWWRYCTEATWEAGRNRPSYHRVLYEDLAEDTVPTIRRVFDFCDLPWNSAVEERVRGLARGAAHIARAWKDELEGWIVETVERVTDGSPARAWWAEDGA